MNKPLIVSARDYGWQGLDLLAETITDQAKRLAVVEGRLGRVEDNLKAGADYWRRVRPYLVQIMHYDDDAAECVGYLDTMFDWTPGDETK